MAPCSRFCASSLRKHGSIEHRSGTDFADRAVQGRPGQDMPEQRILLVEDEATTREILTEFLRREGYAVDSVATAGAASTCLDSIPYELVIADWVLPDGDGTDVADAAAQLGAKTLIVTGYRSDLPAGAGDRHLVIWKGLGYSEIMAAVRRVLVCG